MVSRDFVTVVSSPIFASLGLEGFRSRLGLGLESYRSQSQAQRAACISEPRLRTIGLKKSGYAGYAVVFAKLF